MDLDKFQFSISKMSETQLLELRRLIDEEIKIIETNDDGGVYGIVAGRVMFSGDREVDNNNKNLKE